MTDRRAHNRARMPLSAAEIDGWRAVFGAPKAFYAEENGQRMEYRWTYQPGPPFTPDFQAAVPLKRTDNNDVRSPAAPASRRPQAQAET